MLLSYLTSYCSKICFNVIVPATPAFRIFSLPVRNATRLVAGRAGVRIPVGGEFFISKKQVQTIHKSHQPPFPGRKNGRSVTLTTHSHVALKSRLSWAIPLLPPLPSWNIGTTYFYMNNSPIYWLQLYIHFSASSLRNFLPSSCYSLLLMIIYSNKQSHAFQTSNLLFCFTATHKLSLIFLITQNYIPLLQIIF